MQIDIQVDIQGKDLGGQRNLTVVFDKKAGLNEALKMSKRMEPNWEYLL